MKPKTLSDEETQCEYCGAEMGTGSLLNKHYAEHDQTLVQYSNGEFREVPRPDDELKTLTDDQLATLFTNSLSEEQHGGVDIARLALNLACCRVLEERGREDLLEKCLGPKL
jgi:hypothetical protein